MPELAAFYAVGVIAAFIVGALTIAIKNRTRNRRAAQMIRENLRRADLYWSENEDRVVEWTSLRENEERSKSNKSLMLAAALLAALSWAGAIFLALIALSDLLLARSRRERRLFASAVAKTQMTDRDEIQARVRELDLGR